MGWSIESRLRNSIPGILALKIRVHWRPFAVNKPPIPEIAPWFDPLSGFALAFSRDPAFIAP
jgi:hypothetical protein